MVNCLYYTMNIELMTTIKKEINEDHKNFPKCFIKQEVADNSHVCCSSEYIPLMKTERIDECDYRDTECSSQYIINDELKTFQTRREDPIQDEFNASLDDSNVQQKKRRKALSIEEKIKIINAVDKRGSRTKRQIAKDFGISPSTLLSIIIQRKDIEKAVIQGKARVKKLKPSKHSELDKALIEWFHHAQAGGGAPITGGMIRRQAEEIAKRLNITESTPITHGWINRFKNRYSISCRQAKRSELPPPRHPHIDDVELWTHDLNAYTACDTFAANEFQLFYNLEPGEKIENTRPVVAVFLCTNMDGSEKLPPIIVGRMQNLRCLQGVKSLPCEYRTDKKGCMTATLFKEWLKKFDKRMVEKQRKIILFIDHCEAYSINFNYLRNVKVSFLPDRTHQPFNLGIIGAVTHFYRKKQVRGLVNLIDLSADQRTMKVNVFKAINFISWAWNEVTPQIIKHSFIKAQFGTNDGEPQNVSDFDLRHDANFEDASSRWSDIQVVFGTSMNFFDFLSIDDETTSTSITDVSCRNECDEFDHRNNEPNFDSDVSRVSQAEGMEGLEVFRRYISQLDVEDDVFLTIDRLESATYSAVKNSLKQKTIIDNFLRS